MNDFKQRILTERKELNEKIIKLDNFIQSDNYYKLSEENQDLLKIQLIYMRNYESILTKRITLLNVTN